MKSTKRLEELLDKKDDELRQLQDRLDKIDEEAEREEWRWTCHSETQNEEKLPIPRLEIRCEQIGDNWFNWEWKYALIYRHFTKEIIVVPMGQTRVGSGRNSPPIRPDKTLDLPFRDGVHITHDAGTLKLPAFALCDGVIKQFDPVKPGWVDYKAS